MNVEYIKNSILDIFKNNTKYKKMDKIFVGCINKFLYDKILYFVEQSFFLEYIRKFIAINDFNYLTNKLVVLINTKPNYKDLFNGELSLRIKDKLMYHKLKFTLQNIIGYIVDIYRYDKAIINKFSEETDEIISGGDKSSIKKINGLFVKYFGNNINYYIERYKNNVIIPKVDKLYSKYITPNFKIYKKTTAADINHNHDKNVCKKCKKGYMVVEKGHNVCLECGEYEQILQENNRVFEKKPDIKEKEYNEEEDNKKEKKVEKIIKMKGVDKAILKDYSNIDNMVNILEKKYNVNGNSAKDIWKNYLYSFIKSNRFRPRINKKNSLYLFSIYLSSDILYDDLKKVLYLENYKFEDSKIYDFFDKIFEKTQNSDIYKKKYLKYKNN